MKNLSNEMVFSLASRLKTFHLIY